MSGTQVDLAEFCARVGLDRATAAAALGASGDDRQHSPGYVQALLAVGAWIAALLVIAFVLVLLSLLLEIDVEQATPTIIVLGMLIFAAGAALQRGRPAGDFKHHFAGALLAAGALMVPLAAGVETESAWAAALVAALATAASVLVGRDRAAQFLAAALMLGLVAVGFVADELPFLPEAAALAVVGGTLLRLYPPRFTLGPLAAALLLFTPCLMIVLIQGTFSVGFGFGAAGFGARVIQAALLLWLLWKDRRLAGASIDGTTIVLGAVFLAVALLLPPGGSAALVLMMLGFVLGQRGLAAIGVLFQIYFVSRFYYDLEATLLAKSLVLMAVGVVVLGAYALVRRRMAEA